MNRALVLLVVAAGSVAFAQTPCEQLLSLKLPDTTITMAMTVAAGAFQNPGAPAGPATPALPPAAAQAKQGKQAKGGGAPGAPAAAQQMLPAYCRLSATLRPSPDSDIKIEVWMPTGAGWNGKYEAVGGGGWAGVISYPALANAVQEGYATSSTDTGHEGGNANFAVGHPEKIVDFSYRAVHEMTVKAKAIMTAYYGRGPRLSYWNGCSTGGRQGLMEAQRYPEDFDGIVAGAPANYQTHLHAWDISLQTFVRQAGAAVPAPKTDLVAKAVLAACDAADGVKDSLLNDPRKCNFDAGTLLCKGADSNDCLTALQVESVKKAYAPLKTSKGDLVYPGYAKGSETGWAVLAANGPTPTALSLGSYREVLHQDPNWDWKTWDVDKDVAAVDEKYGYINATNPDLSAFKARGGKLLTYHGWADTAISPENSINYRASVLGKMGAKQDNWYRLFMVPGMGHCGNGPGPNQFNYMGAMERWRESGTAPEFIIAEHVANNKVDMTRPLCAYPQVATYKGVGSTNDAANFSCKAP
jgi:feruloyl esterase